MKPSSIRTKVWLIITLIGIVLFPLLLLIVSNRIQYVRFEYAIPTIFTQLFALPIVTNILLHMAFIGSTLAIIIFSTTFLFEIRISEVTMQHIRQKWYWRFFFRHLIIHDKHVWHILLGYFIAILALNPLVADQFIEIQSRLHPITPYQAYVVTVPIISTILVVARVLSKLDLQVIDTNIGVFIIIVYISELVFSVISFGYIPVKQLVNFITYSPTDAEGIFMIYGSEIIGAVFATFFDWLIITRLLRKKL